MSALTTKFRNLREDGLNNVYGNLVVTNNSKIFQPMDVTINRGEILLKNPEDYYISIIRFSIPTLCLPLFFLDLDNNDYSVTMTYNGSSSTFLLQYESILSTTQTSPEKKTPQGFTLPPFAIWSYQQFVNMINVAIQKCHDALFPPLPGPQPKKAPYMIFNIDSQSFSLIADNSYIEPSPYANPLIEKLFFNNTLFNLFSNFLGVRDEYNPLGLFQFVFQNTFNNNITTKDSLAGVEMKQEYPTLYLLNSISNIVIDSNSFPVSSENQFVSTITDSSFSDNSKNILTDFEINYANQQIAGDSRSIQQYQANVYRYIDMKGTSELRNFIISVSGYLPDLNKYIKLYLLPGETITMKILFKRKNINY